MQLNRKIILLLGMCALFIFIATAGTLNANRRHKKPLAAVDPMAVLADAKTDKNWIIAQKEVYKQVSELNAQHASELQRNVQNCKLMRGDPRKKQIAITFDDGPHPQYTPQILAILKKYNAKATFFLVGEKALQYPNLVKSELAAGMIVGNHTYHHVNLTRIPEMYVAAEIQACSDVLKRITGKRPYLFRPPGGDYNDNVAQVAKSMKNTIVLWTDDPGDYASPGEKVIENRLLDKADNGGIILIHDGIQQTINALPHILQTLHDKGYQFVTIDKMMKNRVGCIKK